MSYYDKIDKSNIPSHIGIIMDGNGRWAKKRHLPRIAGHKQGMETVKNITKVASNLGVKVLTLYAFSTENWKRPAFEVNFLMHLFKNYLIGQLRELITDNVQVHIIGDTMELPSSLQEEIKVCEKDTANNDGLILNVAINYGGRMELVNAVRDISQKVAEGRMEADSVTEETITNHLYPSASSDVDLLIRTGGESRISNFLLWQVSYSELYFTPVLWPDFSSEELEKAVFWFTGRDRRFGGLTEASR